MIEGPQILHETDEYLAISKPAFWVVNDASTAHDNQTVQDWVSANYDFPLSHDKNNRNGIVHRLDKETSGVLLIAKTLDSFVYLQQQFARRLTQKVYTALVHGALHGGGTVTMPIARSHKNRTKFEVTPEGREAQTRFEVQTVYGSQKNAQYSLIRLFPKTGRTHQIRVHMQYIHHPIVSDPLYIGEKLLSTDRAWCPRMFLHASSLQFLDPQTKNEVYIEAPLPTDLSKALKHV